MTESDTNLGAGAPAGSGEMAVRDPGEHGEAVEREEASDAAAVALVPSDPAVVPSAEPAVTPVTVEAESLTAGELRERLAGMPAVTGAVADASSPSVGETPPAVDEPVPAGEPIEAEGHPDPLAGMTPLSDAEVGHGFFHSELSDWHKEIDDLFAPAKALGGQLTPDLVKHALLRTINFLSDGLLDMPPPMPAPNATSSDDVPHEEHRATDDGMPEPPHVENAAVAPGDHTSFDVGTTGPEETRPAEEAAQA